MSGSLSRRRLLELAGIGGVAAVAAGSGAVLFERRENESDGNHAARAVPFYGPHQAGIVTPQQRHLRFASFDLTAAKASEIRDLLATWTAAAARYAVGDTKSSDVGGEFAPPDDTGEAGGLRPSRLTLTFGFGPGLFDDRYGLAAKRPAELIDIPSFALDQLDQAESGGDLCVQACADDPQVAFHAIRNLTRTSHGAASLRWVQEGFLSPTTEGTGTPRNLMGFKDGTANLDPSDDERMTSNVWAAPDARAAWMTGGTYLVARKIRIRIEQWDRTAIGEQEQFIGRVKDSGAPIGAAREHDDVDTKRLDIASHIRLANPRTGEDSERERILRRGYNFAEGIDEIGQMGAGLFFLGYQQDPRRQFVSIQTRLAANDLLNEYLFHTGSAIFAIPPGVQPGGSIGDTLFA
jgi:deferrochelatase/peroxidase EfeB